MYVRVRATCTQLFTLLMPGLPVSAVLHSRLDDSQLDRLKPDEEHQVRRGAVTPGVRRCLRAHIWSVCACLHLQGAPNITAFEVGEETNPAPGTPSFDAYIGECSSSSSCSPPLLSYCNASLVCLPSHPIVYIYSMHAIYYMCCVQARTGPFTTPSHDCGLPREGVGRACTAPVLA